MSSESSEKTIEYRLVTVGSESYTIIISLNCLETSKKRTALLHDE